MNADDVENFLSRWSRRKLRKDADATPVPASNDSGAASVQPPETSTQPAVGQGNAASEAPAEPLQPVESLTPESDFKPFMRPDVDPGVKQAALKQLFRDPHFNVMDGLDTYIDDYGKPDPIPAEMMKKMYQARELLFSPEEKAAAEAADAQEAAEAAAAQAELDRQAEELQQAFSSPGPEAGKDAGPEAPQSATPTKDA